MYADPMQAGTMSHRAWQKDLIEVDLIPNYCANLLCPWAAIYHLLDHMIVTDNDDTTGHGTCSFLDPCYVAPNLCIPCQVPCCLALESAWQYLFPIQPKQKPELKPPSQSPWYQNMPHELLSMSHPASSPDDEEEEEEEGWPVSKTLSDRALNAACIGMLCMLPTMCYLRHKVDVRYHMGRHESLWKTGLVTCIAWPCSLTQLEKEMQHYDSTN